ncbi:MAG: hypothetical protein COA90_02635 [Gammaproteobacteria bacterium]|nr:MAG: hypothetical protein COA90_02635 [Gammaproteobacteria bacterium]
MGKCLTFVDIGYVMSNVLMSLFVCIVATISVMILLKFRSSSQWLPISAHIESSSFKSIHIPHSQQGIGNHSIDYKMNIDYHYIIKGQTFHGNTVMAGFPNIIPDKQEATKMVERFPAGSDAEVFYNPDNVGQSALNTSKGVSLLAIAVIFLFIISIGGGMIWLINSDLMA